MCFVLYFRIFFYLLMFMNVCIYFSYPLEVIFISIFFFVRQQLINSLVGSDTQFFKMHLYIYINSKLSTLHLALNEANMNRVVTQTT